jgi:O-antigen/teichoic acid export membrane protein
MANRFSRLSPPRRWLPVWIRLWAADSAILLVSQFAAIIATSALAILLARHLGPKEWGRFSGFLGLSLALSVFVEFGLTQWLLRELARIWAGQREEASPSEAGRLIAASFSVNAALGVSIVAGAGAVAAGVHLAPGTAALLVALVAYGALLAAASGLEAVFRARRRLIRVIGATLLEKSLLLALVALSLVLDLGLIAIATAYVVAGLSRVIFDAALITRTDEVAWTAPTIADARYVTRRSVPFAMNRASLNIIPRLDTFILAAIAPIAAGYFALGDRILGPIVIIPVVMSSALYPFLARESAGSRAAWKVVLGLGLLGAAVAGIGITAAPTLVPVVFGSDYSSAVHVVQVMLLATPFVFGANPLLAHLYTERLERRTLGLTLGVVSLFGTGAIVLGQVLVGPTGAAGGYALRAMLSFTALTLAGRAAIPAQRRVTEVAADSLRDPEAPSELAPAARQEGFA